MEDTITVKINFKKSFFTEVLKESGYQPTHENIKECTYYIKELMRVKYTNSSLSQYGLRVELERAIESDVILREGE